MIIVYISVSSRFSKLFEDFCYMKAKVLTIQTVNSIVTKEMENISYDDLVKYEKNDEGKINLIKFNTVLINSLISKSTLSIQNELTNLEDNKIEIPLGTILGSKVFADYGPRIKIMICPSRKCKLSV